MYYIIIYYILLLLFIYNYFKKIKYIYIFLSLLIKVVFKKTFFNA